MIEYYGASNFRTVPDGNIGHDDGVSNGRALIDLGLWSYEGVDYHRTWVDECGVVDLRTLLRYKSCTDPRKFDNEPPRFISMRGENLLVR